jgi:tetratricopeptide (TPR) repeat protein
VESFTQAIASAPGYRDYFNRASAYQHLGGYKKAIADYSQALQYKPDSAPAFHDRGLCEMRLDQIDDAARDYDQALKLEPENPRTWNGRGAVYLKQLRYREAIECFGKAIQFDPSLAGAYKSRAVAEKAIGDHRAAKADLAQAKAIEGGNAR